MRQFYYKLRQLLQTATTLLQNATVITKCDVFYKLRQYDALSVNEDNQNDHEFMQRPIGIPQNR